jgi:hypothetical protein
MPDITLLSDSLPDLLPMKNRSPGLHISDIIRYICIERGYFDESQTLDMTRCQLGSSLEWAIIQRYRLHYGGDSIVIPGELTLDGIPGTPDMLWMLEINAVHEIKYTDRSSKSDSHCLVGGSPTLSHAIFSDKFWKDRAQLCCYCKMMWSLTGDISWSRGRLEICHAKGDYSIGKVIHNTWEMVFSQKEMNEMWLMVRSYKKLIEREQNRRSVI